MGIRRTLALGKNILNTDALEDGTHSATSDNTGTRGCGFQKDLRATILTHLLMRNGSLKNRNADEVLLGIINTFLNCSLNFFCLAKAITDHAIFISNNDDGSKSKGATTFSDLSHPIDSD